MSDIVEFRLESGESIYVEAAAEPRTGLERAGRRGEALQKATESFEAALEKVKPAARAVVEAFRELNEPDEINLEFGIQFKTSANVFVLTGESNASFKLSLKWTNET